MGHLSRCHYWCRCRVCFNCFRISLSWALLVCSQDFMIYGPKNVLSKQPWESLVVKRAVAACFLLPHLPRQSPEVSRSNWLVIASRWSVYVQATWEGSTLLFNTAFKSQDSFAVPLRILCSGINFAANLSNYETDFLCAWIILWCPKVLEFK